MFRSKTQYKTLTFPLAHSGNLEDDTGKTNQGFLTMHAWAKPGPFLKWSNYLLPLLKLGCVVAFGFGLTYALFLSPPDYQQGEAMRIMYVHVPASWMALGVYTFIAIMSLFALVWRHPLAELLAQAAAPIGAIFTIVSLLTGSIWGKPMWGAWWVWDARLTSVLILLFLYAGYMALSRAFDDPQRGIRVASILALIGWVNIPIIKFSVDWWNTLHQPASLTKFSAPNIHSSMLTPLLIMTGAYVLYFLVVLTIRTRIEYLRRKALTGGTP